MKISNDFGNFKEGSTLFVVAGKLSAKLYKINAGKLFPENEVAVPKPNYSDKPGVFRNNGKGTRNRTGAVQEVNDVHEQHEFFRVLGRELEKLKFPYEKLYLFAPRNLQNLLKKYLPKPALEKLQKEIDGNFLKSHPTELLKRAAATGGAGPDP